MRDSALQFLTGVLGVDGARALARTADREPALEPLLVPRAALAWLRDRPDFEGLIPGQRNSYLSFQKSERGYDGVVSLPETNYEFLGATPEHLAAALALAVGVDPALRHPVRDLTLARLGKSIDALARAHDLAKALPKILKAEPHAFVSDIVVGARGGKCRDCKEPLSHANHRDPNDPKMQARIEAKLRGTPLGRLANLKTELPGKTHQPTAQQGPEGPQGPQKQPQMPKPKLPKVPGLRVGKSEQDQACPSCGGQQFVANVFRGCICFKDLAKHVRTTVYGDGVVLNFGPGFPPAALPVLRKALLP